MLEHNHVSAYDWKWSWLWQTIDNDDDFYKCMFDIALAKFMQNIIEKKWLIHIGFYKVLILATLCNKHNYNAVV